MIVEQEQQTDARISHETALALAAQAVIDAAAMVEDNYWELNGTAIAELGPMQDLQNAIEAWRELGGQTTDERAAVGMEDHYFSKGTTLP